MNAKGHYLPLSVVCIQSGVLSQGIADVIEFSGGNVQQEVVEPVLPLVAVRNGRELEGGAVQENELLVGDGVHLLDLVAHLNVLSDGLVKVCHSRVLCSPATEEGILLDRPDNLESKKNTHTHTMDHNMLINHNN